MTYIAILRSRTTGSVFPLPFDTQLGEREAMHWAQKYMEDDYFEFQGLDTAGEVAESCVPVPLVEDILGGSDCGCCGEPASIPYVAPFYVLCRDCFQWFQRSTNFGFVANGKVDA